MAAGIRHPVESARVERFQDVKVADPLSRVIYRDNRLSKEDVVVLSLPSTDLGKRRIVVCKRKVHRGVGEVVFCSSVELIRAGKPPGGGISALDHRFERWDEQGNAWLADIAHHSLQFVVPWVLPRITCQLDRRES